MPRLGIDGLVAAVEAVVRTGVDHVPASLADAFAHLVHGHGTNAADREFAGRVLLISAIRPRGVTTVEHRRGRVSGPTGHPPEARGEHPAGVVVGDHLVSPRNAVRAQEASERVAVG